MTDTSQPRVILTDEGLVFKVPRTHAGAITVARLHVVCTVHPDDEPLVTYSMQLDGHEHVSPGGGWRSEFVNDKEIDLGGKPLPSFLDAPEGVDPDSPPHFRHRFTCPRPSCRFDAAVRCDGESGLNARVTAALRGLVEGKIPAMTVTNIDGVWRVVSTSGPE